MNSYKGPIRRKIKKYIGDSEFTVDGTADHLESRNAFVKQTFILEQIHDNINGVGEMAQEWMYPEEVAEFGFDDNSRVPFKDVHKINDRFLINKSIKNLKFKPYQSYNYLEIDNESKIRMLPLLCSDRTYRNVTRKPIVSYDNHTEIASSVYVQMGAYGRFWFGSTWNYSDELLVTNRVGEGPYFVDDATHPVGFDLGGGVLNSEKPSVWGFLPTQLGAGQPLRLSNEMLHIDQQIVDRWCGQIEFVFNESEDYYESKPFEVVIPYILENQCMYHSHTTADTRKLNVMVPSMKTSTSEYSPYNYFFYNDVGTSPRMSFPHAAGVGGITVAGTIDETLNTQDFVKVHIGTLSDVVKDPKDYNAGVQIAQSYHDIYMFVPAFRITKGHRFASSARPKRFGATAVAATETDFNLLNTWTLPTPDFPVVDVDPLAENIHLKAQIPFWANYFTEQARITDTGAYNEEARFLYDYVKIGSIQHSTTTFTTINDADTHPVIVLKFVSEDQLAGDKYADIRSMIDNILALSNRPQADRDDPGEENASWFCLTNVMNPFGIPDRNAIKTLRINLKYLNYFYDGDYTDDIYGGGVEYYRDYGGEVGFFHGRTHDEVKELLLARREVQMEFRYNPAFGDVIPHYLFREGMTIFKNPRTLDKFKDMLTAAIAANVATAAINVANAAQNVGIAAQNVIIVNYNAANALAPEYPLVPLLPVGLDPPFPNDVLTTIRLIRDLSKYGSEIHSENQFAKPFTERSAFEISDMAEEKEEEEKDNGGAHGGYFVPAHVVDVDEDNPVLPLELLPQPQLDNALGPNFAIYANGIDLYMPVRRTQKVKLALPHEVYIECVEPFIGYGSGEHVLEAKSPLDCRYDKNFSLGIQDYTYSFSRDGSELLKNGYKNDQNTSLRITAMTDPMFTTVSDKLTGVQQQNKSVTDIRELSSHIEKYQLNFQAFQASKPFLEFEVRSGMFEYLFLWIEYAHDHSTQDYPVTDPVIEGVEIRIRGRDNQFIKSLEKDDIAQLSRNNCHSECEWRELHDSGQGILLHLADIGLTESITYGDRERIQFKITLSGFALPDGTDKTVEYLENPQLVFKIALVRKNQAFRGDENSCRFEYLNEI